MLSWENINLSNAGAQLSQIIDAKTYHAFLFRLLDDEKGLNLCGVSKSQGKARQGQPERWAEYSSSDEARAGHAQGHQAERSTV